MPAETKTIRAVKNNVSAVADKTAEAAEASAARTTDTAERVTEAAFSFPTYEVPEMFRSFTEQSLSQTRDAYQKMKASAEETTDAMEESFEAARGGIVEAQMQALDAAKANSEATLEFAKKLLSTTSVADAFQLQASFARERFEALVDYTKTFQASLTKTATEASAPSKALFEKAISQSKAA